MERFEIAVIGAGVVGLAVAARLSQGGRSLILVEQHDSFGRETSSRNSEVIHAGLYYEPGSLKANLCVEGNRLLAEYCAAKEIPHRFLGKLVVARSRDEEENLEQIRLRALANGVEGLRYLSRDELSAYEPRLRGTAALYSPRTGIIDSHALMRQLEYETEQNGALITYNTRVEGIARSAIGYRLRVLEDGGDSVEFEADAVVNCAGLQADLVAQMAGFDIDVCGYRVRYSKGEYYSVSNQKALISNHLVYPVQGYAVGIHTVVDLQGQVKVGPKLYPIDENRVDYQMDDRHRPEFFRSLSGLFPLLREEDLTPDMAGISAALAPPADDWSIHHESLRGWPGFVNLIGMKSPALTACLAIARHVEILLA